MWGSRPTRRRRLAAIASASVAALLFAGCGGDNGTEETALQVVTASADRTTSGGTARMTMRSAMSVGTGATTELVSGEGTVDFDTGRAAMTLSPQGVDETIELRQIDKESGFFTMPYLDLPDGKHWIRIDADQVSESGLGTVGDPENTLLPIEGLAGEPEQVGRETLHGTETTRYDFEIDIDKLFDVAAEHADRLSPDLESLMNMGRDMLPDTGHGRVWIDDDGRVRKFDFLLEIEAMGQRVTSITSVEWFDFGVAVEVEAPPADQVVPWEDVKDQLTPFRNPGLTGG